jgi:hypothetical protein
MYRTYLKRQKYGQKRVPTVLTVWESKQLPLGPKNKPLTRKLKIGYKELACTKAILATIVSVLLGRRVL